MMRRVSLREGFSADDVSEDIHTYESVLCVICGRFHFVNPATGTVAGQQNTQAESRKELPKSVNRKAKHRQRGRTR